MEIKTETPFLVQYKSFELITIENIGRANDLIKLYYSIGLENMGEIATRFGVNVMVTSAWIIMYKLHFVDKFVSNHEINNEKCSMGLQNYFRIASK